MKTIDFSHCSTSQIKANTGRNTSYKLNANRQVLFPEKWNVNEKINYKSFLANPSDLYKDYELYNKLFNK